jgi:hypothetical protein
MVGIVSEVLERRPSPGWGSRAFMACETCLCLHRSDLVDTDQLSGLLQLILAVMVQPKQQRLHDRLRLDMSLSCPAAVCALHSSVWVS